MRLSPFSIALYGAAAAAAALDPIEVVGNKFFNKDGSQFFLKGVAYQLRPSDPLVDTDQCKRDASLMKELGANSIRVYHVDPSADHDGCMKAFEDVGIYVLVDLDTFDTYILPTELNWNSDLFSRYAEVMDVFQQYANVLGFFIGNENIAKRRDSPVAPYLKAAARDMKAYRDEQGYRKIPVGYSAADIIELRPMLEYYLTCGGNSSEIVDFFGLNSYSWCDPSSYKTSGYDQLQEYAVNFPVPIFFTETGCNVPGPRVFDDQDAIFGDEMNKDWSGAIIYEWIEEANNYGLITYGPETKADSPDVEDGFLRKGTPSPKNPDFENLKAKWAALHPTGVKKADYDPSQVTTPACPKSTQGGWWEVDGDVPLPTLGGILATTRSLRSKPTSAATATDAVATTVEPTATKATMGATTGATGAATGAATTAAKTTSSSSRDHGDKTSSAPGPIRALALGASVTAAMAVVTFWL